MSAPNLGKLERVDLRTSWWNEIDDFTPWLAGGEALGGLGDALRMELEYQGYEEPIGCISPISYAGTQLAATSSSLDDARPLVLSPFPATVRRTIAKLAAHCNDLVADLAAQVFIAHAATGSKIEDFAYKLSGSGKPLLTLGSPANGNLTDIGAEAVGIELGELKRLDR